MMMDWVVYVVQIKPGRRRSNAEAHQLIREAVNARRAKSLHYRLLAGLGRSLSAWGERLQSHYDAARCTPIELTALDMASHE